MKTTKVRHDTFSRHIHPYEANELKTLVMHSIHLIASVQSRGYLFISISCLTKKIICIIKIKKRMAYLLIIFPWFSKGIVNNIVLVKRLLSAFGSLFFLSFYCLVA